MFNKGMDMSRNNQNQKVLILYGGYGHTCGPSEALWYSKPYIDYIVSKCIEHNVQYKCLVCEDSRRVNVWNLHSCEKFDIVIANGHGREDVLTTYRLDPVYFIDMVGQGFKRDWVENSTFLTISCLTAAKLGPFMVNNLGVLNYLGFVKEFVMYVHYGRRWFSGDWRFSLDILFLKPLAEAFTKFITGEFTIDDVYNYIKQKWEEYLRDPLIPELVKDAIRWNLNALRLIKRSSSTSELTVEESRNVKVRVTLFDGYTEFEVFNKVVKVGEKVSTEIDVPNEVREGSGSVRFYIEDRLIHEVKVIFVKQRKEYEVIVYEPKEGQEVEIGGKLKIVFEVREKTVEKPSKHIEITCEYIARNIKVNDTRRIGVAVDTETPCDLAKPENCCRYVVGIVKPGTTEAKFGERIFITPGIHTIDICVDLQEGEELELTLNIYTPLGKLTKTKKLTATDRKLTTTIKITEEEAKIIE